MTRRELLAGAGAVLLAGLGCADGVPDIAWDLDACAECRMTLSDRRFGAVTRDAGGRAVRFDSLECLARWVERQVTPVPTSTIHVVDAGNPGALLPLKQARIHRGTAGSSPMGLGFIAFGADGQGAGKPVAWADVRAAVRQAGPGGH